MREQHRFSHQECPHYVSEYYIGFRIVESQKWDRYEGHKFEFHSLIFMLEGEVEFSYNEFIGHRFKRGDLFFIPHASLMYGLAIMDSRMLVLSFNNRVNALCDNCALNNYIAQFNPAEYDFAPLPIHPKLELFVSVMERYIHNNVRCNYLHHLKQQELFILLQYCYTKEEVVRLFYPILGKPTFHSWVLENFKPGMSMVELASRCNMNERSFSRKFFEVFGVTFRDWMLEQRVKRIRLRMSMPETTLKEIMTDFDFSSSSHLARFCRDNYGMTPTAMLDALKRKPLD